MSFENPPITCVLSFVAILKSSTSFFENLDFPKDAIVSASDAVITELHHFGPSTLFPLIKDCPTKKLLIIHIDECNRELFEQATIEFSKNATCPKDGDIYIL